jgi:hypothetical protein
MQDSQKIAIAAHLHVLLRRKTGRVTDTEWMASNAAYATEIVRFCRASALQDGHTDLAEWADKLEEAVLGTNRVDRRAAAPVASPAASPPQASGVAATALRYVRGIR